MAKMNDLTGQRFGRLIAIKSTNKRNVGRNVIWLCKCECGNTSEISSGSLLSGDTKSCGCLAREKNQQKSKIKQSSSNSWNGTHFNILGLDCNEAKMFKSEKQGFQKLWWPWYFCLSQMA